MGIFEQFPYSNFHNANLDNVLHNSNQALRDAANAVHIAGEAKDMAESLADDVATALQEAESASTAAASAEATAAQAQAEAEAVSGLAQDAYDLASAADSAAANALSVANTANSNASTALSTANTANTNANNAVTTANAANTAASNAVQDAADAVTIANTANDLATQAAADASAALSGLIRLQYIDRSFSNLTIPSQHYVLVGDCITDFGMPSTATPLSFFIRGWSGVNAPITLVLGSNGTTIYAIGTVSQTISRIYIRLWYIE